MDTMSLHELIGELRCKAAPIERRQAAARLLGDSDDPTGIAALLAVAEDAAEDGDLGRVAGQSLAAAYLRAGRLYDAPLANISEPAYVGFDEEAARSLRQVSA